MSRTLGILCFAFYIPFRSRSPGGFWRILWKAVLNVNEFNCSSAEVAKHLEDDSFGLIFGINTLIALTLQTILTIVVVSEQGFALPIVGQYTVLSVYFYVLALFYVLAICSSLFQNCSRST